MLALNVAGTTDNLSGQAPAIVKDFLQQCPEAFNLTEIQGRLKDLTPFTNFFLQEIERMNRLVETMKASLLELDLGLKGERTMSTEMRQLMECLHIGQVPGVWRRHAYLSLRSLRPWLADLLQRYAQLAAWATEFRLPEVTWISGFFFQPGFLTAIQQTAARGNGRSILATKLHFAVLRNGRQNATYR